MVCLGNEQRSFRWGKHTDWYHPPWPGTIVTICMCCFTTGGPGKEHRTNKPPPTGRVQDRSKGDITCPTTSQNPFLQHPSLLNKAYTPRKDSESEWLAKDNPETNPITINLRLWAVLLGSLTLLLSTQVPFPNKVSCFVSTCVSLDNSLPSVRQEPSFGPWKGPPLPATILSFFRLHPSTAFWTLYYEGSFISYKGFLPTVVDSSHLN